MPKNKPYKIDVYEPKLKSWVGTGLKYDNQLDAAQHMEKLFVENPKKSFRVIKVTKGKTDIVAQRIHEQEKF